MLVRFVRFYGLVSQRSFSTKVLIPERKHVGSEAADTDTKRVEIDYGLLDKLCRLTLLDCNNAKTREELEKMVNFAKKIEKVDTTGVDCFTAVHYDFLMEQRKDTIVDGTLRSKILANAVLTKDNYYVTPIANPVDDTANDPNTIETQRKC